MDLFLLEADPGGSQKESLAAQSLAATQILRCSWRNLPVSGVTGVGNRVRQGGLFKEAPRVLIGLVFKKTPCKNTPLKTDFTSRKPHSDFSLFYGAEPLVLVLWITLFLFSQSSIPFPEPIP